MAYFHTTVLDNQIKALPTVSTASGSIATFDTDMTENLVEVKCQIVAQQSGSGTPSPSNPRPITTYTEMNVCHSSRNMIEPNEFVQRSGYSNLSVSVTNNVITVTNYNSGGRFACFNFLTEVGKTYTIKYSARSNIIAAKLVRSDTKPTVWNNTDNVSVLTNTPLTFTSVKPWYQIWFEINGEPATITDLQVEIGSTATAFEPFGTTANIPFGQTVAQGILNVGTGKLRVTYGITTINNNWSMYSTYFYKTFNDKYTPTVGDTEHIVVCSMLPYCGVKQYASQMPNETIGQAENKNLYIIDNGCADITAFHAKYNGATIIYPLATPIEIQLDSITLQALLNENNIWCDTGDTEVKFLLTVGKKIS